VGWNVIDQLILQPRRRHAWYAITDSRVLLLSGRAPTWRIVSYPWGSWGRTEQIEAATGAGSIRFVLPGTTEVNRLRRKAREIDSADAATSLQDIPDVASVHRLLCHLRDTFGSAPPPVAAAAPVGQAQQ
jgi:hypothetical protein